MLFNSPHEYSQFALCVLHYVKGTSEHVLEVYFTVKRAAISYRGPRLD